MIVREPDNLCVICGAVIPEERQVCPICGTKDNIEGYAQLIRRGIPKPVPDFKVDDRYEQSFREGYIKGFEEGMKTACVIKQENEWLKRKVIILEQQASNTAHDIDAEYE